MKVFLLGRDRDVDWSPDPPTNHEELTQDLELATLFAAMAADKEYLGDIARRVVLASLTDPDTITYRQGVLADCLAASGGRAPDLRSRGGGPAQPEEGLVQPLFRDSPDIILRRSVEILELLIDSLHQLRALADEHGRRFRSEGFVRFFAMVGDELDDEYFAPIEAHLTDLRLPDGVLMSAELGQGNKGVRYVLHRPPHLSWWERLTGFGGSGYTFQILRPRRGRCASPARPGGTGRQPRGQRAGPVGRSRPELLPHAARRAGLLPRLH